MIEMLRDNITFIFTIAGSFVSGLIVPLMIYFAKKRNLRREIVRLKSEVSRLAGVGATLEFLQGDLKKLLDKQDYSETIKSGLDKNLQPWLTKIEKTENDFNTMMSVVHDKQIALSDAALLAWDDKVEGVNNILTTPVTQSVLHKKECEINKLESVIRDIKGDDAESLINGCRE